MKQTRAQTHLNGTLVVMGHIQEHGVSNRRHERTQAGLNKGSDRLSTVTVDQPALFMAVSGGHGLWQQDQRGSEGLAKTGCTIRTYA